VAHIVKTLTTGVVLTDGNYYPTINTTVVLTDDEYAELDPGLFTRGSLQDLGPTNEPLMNTLTTLTYASTVTTNAAVGNRFQITLTGNLTLANPTNGTDGQMVLWRFIQDSTGSRTLTLGSAFNLGSVAVTLSTGANKVDYLGAVYRVSTSKWDVLAFQVGY
jgi:hypothetical protein